MLAKGCFCSMFATCSFAFATSIAVSRRDGTGENDSESDSVAQTGGEIAGRESISGKSDYRAHQLSPYE
jgi:hypothetical protein